MKMSIVVIIIAVILIAALAVYHSRERFLYNPPPLNLAIGYQIDDPKVFIPWDIDENGLHSLLDKHGLKKVTDGYYYISCQSLGSLRHELGFHFQINDEKSRREFEKYMASLGAKDVRKIEPRRNRTRDGKLIKLEFFRKTPLDIKKSFEEFQSVVEAAFGRPQRSEDPNSAEPYYEWRFRGIKIHHFIIDRFGPEEHLAIERI